MLAQYQTLTTALLQSPSAPVPLIATSTLNVYINNARLQVAAQGGCIRRVGSLALVGGTRVYGFSQITGLGDGVATVYHIRQLWYNLGDGQVLLTSRPFEYFSLYDLNNTSPASGQPERWSQYGQGEAGSLYVAPVPDGPYDCPVDTLAVPILLVDDSTVEVIPDIWTLAVPFYAAWLGYMSRQRQPDADRMMQRFQEQMALARSAANPDLLPENWVGSSDPMMANRLGVQTRR